MTDDGYIPFEGPFRRGPTVRKLSPGESAALIAYFDGVKSKMVERRAAKAIQAVFETGMGPK